MDADLVNVANELVLVGIELQKHSANVDLADRSYPDRVHALQLWNQLHQKVVIVVVQDNCAMETVHLMETVQLMEMVHLVEMVDAHVDKVDAGSEYTETVDVDSCFPVPKVV